MTKAVPKTIEEHRDYLFSIIRLKLFFLARWQQDHPEEAFSFTLRKRVDIFRKTDLNPEGLVSVGDYYELPPWQKVEKRLQEIYLLVKGDEKCFEEWGFDFLRPYVERRCERDFYDRSPLAAYQCGFLRYNTVPNQDGQTLGFHIANNRCPDSFFDDPAHIRVCFNLLLDAAENQFHVKNISTGTWLNSVPKFLVLFPQEWLDHMSAPDTNVMWHYGFWGQFINARGTLNEKAAAVLRTTGKMPYYPRSSRCSIKAMREHINSI